MAGRKLANRPMFLRRPRMACSGRSGRSSLSYFQSPTEPNSTASDAMARLKVCSGSGWPWASKAAPPTLASSSWKGRSSTFSTLTASLTISGPMPSSGSTAIFMTMVVLSSSSDSNDAVVQPGLLGQALGLVGLDLVGVAQGQADVVKAVEQAVLAEGLDVEGQLGAIALDDDLALEVDGQLVAGEGKDFVEQLIDLLLAQHDGQQAVLEAVVEEDVGKAGRDDGAKAVLVQGPGCVLAAGGATEVLTRDQDGSTLVARLVQHEVGVGLARSRVLAGLAGVEVAPLVEQVGAEARALDRLEVLLGDDGVGVDVLAVHGGHKALVNAEGLHGDLFTWRPRPRWFRQPFRCPCQCRARCCNRPGRKQRGETAG